MLPKSHLALGLFAKIQTLVPRTFLMDVLMDERVEVCGNTAQGQTFRSIRHVGSYFEMSMTERKKNGISNDKTKFTT